MSCDPSTLDVALREEAFGLVTWLLTSLLPRLTPGKSRLILGSTGTHYDETAAELEGFSRALWGVVPLLMGHKISPIEYLSEEIEVIRDTWRTGLINGCDPTHKEFWGKVQDRDQRMVEMCAIGFALGFLPDVFWDPLNDDQKHNVATWLGEINFREMPKTNWRWFRVMANVGLHKVGASTYDSQVLELDLEFMDTFFVDESWSADGPVSEGIKQMDYYSASFALQFAPLLFMASDVAKKEHKVRCQMYRARAQHFASSFVRWFDEKGRAIPFGRSMTYRWAMAGYWSALPFAKILPPHPWNDVGVLKGIWARNIRWFLKQKGVISSNGSLSIGYTYENLFLTENYNSPGSPYWAFLAFLPLALGDEEEWWTTKEKDLPSHELSISQAVLKAPGQISIRADAHTYVLSAGQQPAYRMRHGAQKYCKLAYSSAFGYSVPTAGSGLEQHNPDSVLSLSDDEGETWKVPHRLEGAGYDEEKKCLWSSWKPWPDVLVKTYLIAPDMSQSPNWHVRIHQIMFESGKRHLLTSDATFAVADRMSQGDRRRFASATNIGLDSISDGDDYAFICSSQKGATGVRSLRSNSKLSRRGFVLAADASSNIIEPRTSIPLLLTAVDESCTLVTGIFAAVPNEKEDTIDVDTLRKHWFVDVVLPEWVKDLLG